ncbi:hypothetical protein GCM10023116_20700 [Kistimonas scapharcae]|uniref:Sel1 repeat family protein n=1 Tax=Kistimonas scapharcae TaxID=1036133 RepID=A0ABP8V2I7_9GAMM
MVIRNYLDAQFNLAVMYEKGDGVKKNYEIAYYWFSVAANRGDQEAITKRDNIGNKLTPEDLRIIQLKARGFNKA